MPSKQTGRFRRKDKAAGPFPSVAVGKRLKSIPEEVEEVITPEDWANAPRVPGFDEEGFRHFCNRIIAYYRLNKGVPKQPPREIRKDLDRKAKKLRGWIAQLSELNDRAEFFAARSKVCLGKSAPERKKNARDQVRILQEGLEKIAGDLEKASDVLPRGTTRIREQKSGYFLNCCLRMQTDKGIIRSESSHNKTIDFAIWLFRKADPDVVPETIKTAARKAVRKEMNDDDYMTLIHPSSGSILDPYFKEE